MAGTRYARLLPTPVPACTTSWPPDSRTDPTASAISRWPLRTSPPPGRAVTTRSSASASLIGPTVPPGYDTPVEAGSVLATRIGRERRCLSPERCLRGPIRARGGGGGASPRRACAWCRLAVGVRRRWATLAAARAAPVTPPPSGTAAARGRAHGCAAVSDGPRPPHEPPGPA